MLKLNSELRAQAREALRGKWPMAAVAALILRGSIQNVAWTKCRTKYVKPLVHR